MDRKATAEEIMMADSCTLKLSNQKNGWRVVCINHHTNGNSIMCPVRVIGRRYIHITANKYKPATFLSTHWVDGDMFDVTVVDTRSALKHTGGVPNDPELKGISIDRINTHSLQGGGANALSLSGYSTEKSRR